MGLLYDSSLMGDDDCYELLMNGEPTGVVELPVEWIRDDAVYLKRLIAERNADATLAQFADIQIGLEAVEADEVRHCPAPIPTTRAIATLVSGPL